MGNKIGVVALRPPRDLRLLLVGGFEKMMMGRVRTQAWKLTTRAGFRPIRIKGLKVVCIGGCRSDRFP